MSEATTGTRTFQARGPLVAALVMAGSIAYLDVIVAQAELVRARPAVAEQNRQMASSLVLPFRTLGGGWSPWTATTFAQAGAR